MNMQEMALRRTIPVVINSFNQLFYLNNIVEKFLQNGFRNLYIIDQGSSYPPLRSYLESIHLTTPNVLPIYLDNNNGPRWFIENSIHHMFGSECIIFTDPDIIFEKFADDYVFKLIELSHKYKVGKVGSALRLENLNDSYSNMHGKIYSIREWENQFWTNELEKNIYAAPIDTTLHLLNKEYYSNATFFKAIRVAGAGYEVEHAPWLVSDPMPEEEKIFYASAKNGWGCWNAGNQPERKEKSTLL